MAEQGEPTLGWSIPNLITVTLMVLVTFAVAGFVARLVRTALPSMSTAGPSDDSAS